jgi:glutamate dehydrogenase
VHAFYEKLMLDTLAQMQPARALEIARYCYKKIHKATRLPHITLQADTIAVDGASCERVRLTVLNANSPFLVDSVSAALHNLGLKTYVTLHPILHVTRKKDGSLQRIDTHDASPKDATHESLIYFELAPPPEHVSKSDIKAAITEVLAHVSTCVTDWKHMDAELHRVQIDFAPLADESHATRRAEIHDFLDWLRNKNFVFLGLAHFTLQTSGKTVRLTKETKTALGVYRFNGHHSLIEHSTTPTAGKDILINKSSRHSLVHRDVAMDYIALARYDTNGTLIGETRLLGLFTSHVYYQSASNIPFLRHKIGDVLRESGFDHASHSGKALKTILEFLPRDEVFQVTHDELFAISMGVLSAEMHPKVRFFMREDPFGRFLSALIYVPKDRFNTTIREQISRLLERTIGGEVTNFYTQISESPLARLHLFIRHPKKAKISLTSRDIEEEIASFVNVWDDALRDALIDKFGVAKGEHLASRYGAAFGQNYEFETPAKAAVFDVAKIEACIDGDGLELEIFDRKKSTNSDLHIKAYTTNINATLSDILPMLDQMGLIVRNVTPYEISPKDAQPVLMRDFSLNLKRESERDLMQDKDRIEEALNHIWRGEMANDTLNTLVFTTDLSARNIDILRGIVRYMQQIGTGYRTGFIMRVLVQHPAIAADMAHLFDARFRPNITNREKAVHELKARITNACESVSNLAEDRVLRKCLAVIMACLRTNAYQHDSNGRTKPYLSYKFCPAYIPDMPLPVPHAEIFVTSQRVEGVHLRGDRVARGGLRWSDRPEDFRTEVLGLVKAQMVKNAVIVPSGAKGGFVVRNHFNDRDAFMQEGKACYRMFLSGLLDITDNMVRGNVTHPSNVIRYDGDDPYLVVAADKGTATFSDIANEVAAGYGFWLGDGFASGGSEGYDHKAMGITARGAWVSVERHFREMGHDVAKEPFTAIGIGDMSGDVFGNGLLLSKQCKLVAAFNHRHIFLDPNPDPKTSFTERKRLFKLARSGWNDYDSKKISKGGGVHERTAKSIAITKEVRDALDITETRLSPDELIQAILKAPVDLFWNGGIGTYVKSSLESHEDVGDRNNNAVRVNGEALRCRVVGEGGNLGFTQLGRIEYARAGGRINTDAIDNSAGVDCSDHEVNIKIAFGDAIQAKRTTLDKRNQMLRSMTDIVAELVLEDNRLQTQAITLAELEGNALVEPLERLMQRFENSKLLNRAMEFLPSDKQLIEMRHNKHGFTRPELSVLLSYSKLAIYQAIKDDAALDSDYFTGSLIRYFPKAMHGQFEQDILRHPLRREIIATRLTNSLVNRMGIHFAQDMSDETGLPMRDVVQAYALARNLFGLVDIWRDIEALDGSIDVSHYAHCFERTQHFAEHVTRWLLSHLPQPMHPENVHAGFSKGIATLRKQLHSLAPEALQHAINEDEKQLTQWGVPVALASEIAQLPFLASACDIVEASELTGRSIREIASLYFNVGEAFHLRWLRMQARAVDADTGWQRMANQSVVTELYQEQQRIVLHITIDAQKKRSKATALYSAWQELHKDAIARYHQQMEGLVAHQDSLDYAMLLVALRHVGWLASQ